MKSLLLAATLALAAAGPVLAGAKKQSDVAIRFYAEGGAEGGQFSEKVELISPKRAVSMQSLPLLTEREIQSFHPFEARDGSGTMGAYFKLDAHGNSLLAQHTMAHRGTYLLAFFNGRHVIDLYVDRGVSDGIVSIPSGLTTYDIARLEIAFPRFGHEGEKPGRKKAPPKSAGPAPTPPAALVRLQPAMARQSDGTLAPAQATLGSPDSSATDVPRPRSPIGQ